MLSYGCTRLEIGVQSTYEDVARDTNRGHTVAAVEDCFSLAKDAGFKDILVGLLRLRKCGKNATCPELMGKCSIVRELHVYGTAVPVHGRDADKLQHQGYGTLLMEEAEGIATREHRSTKIAVISVEYLNIEFERENRAPKPAPIPASPDSTVSVTDGLRLEKKELYIVGSWLEGWKGVGTRHYYRKLGYELEGPYMVKYLE
ncbi:hypothetical protein SASPL_135632 [Salvia splendens]|uniref:Radical SAM core domain-containing protein n=1 Tax=Salvia splendens TaxID=180675 RepID=A0A8X8X0J6_SALSN|nr:hypothetical protein SASPL_135632 [Salvia splendens]